jgi:tetratricopeptide (TPR) repeat protein
MSERRPRKRAGRATSETRRRPGHEANVPVAAAGTVSAAQTVEARFFSRAVWIGLGLIAIVIFIYAPVRQYQFVYFDDQVYVSQNPRVADGLTWQGLAWAFTTRESGNWFPLTWLSHMLDAQLYGVKAGPHHVTSVVLHAINTLLLFGLLLWMTGALWRSAFVAGLFGAHPLHVESVAWVAERKDVLSTMLWMLAVWAYVAYVRRPGLGRYLTVAGLFAMGLMAKPMLVTLPFVLLLLDFWPLGRVPQAPLERRSAILRLLREKLPLLALSAASSVATFVVQQRGGAMIGTETALLRFRMANAVTSYTAYLGDVLWPARLAAFYPYPQMFPDLQVAGSIVLLIGLTALAIRAAGRYPYLSIGWLWYLGTLAPVIGLVQVGGQARADRYTYVPVIGLFLIVAWGVPGLIAADWRYGRIALAAAGALSIAACALAARQQVQSWENDLTLWEHALKVTVGNFRAHSLLGKALAERGKLDEAAAHYSEALRIWPDYGEAAIDLAAALSKKGGTEQAIGFYTQALATKPGSADLHNALGNAFSDRGRLDDAIAQYSEALKLRPGYAEAHANWANVLYREGKLDQAATQYSEALRIKPDLANAYNGLGAVLADQGKLNEAIAQYSQALRINPSSAQAHNNLGAALAEQGHIDEALREFLEALRIQPDGGTHYNAGVMLLRQGKREEAAGHFQAAMQLDPGNQNARRALDELMRQGVKTTSH